MLLVVVARHDHAGLHPNGLDDVDAVRDRARAGHGVPDRRRVLGREEDLEAELAAEAGARQDHGRAAELHLLGDEPEVPQPVHVGVGDRAHEVARPRPLDLQARQVHAQVLERDVEALRGVLEVRLPVHAVRHHPQVVAGEAEHRAVVDEQSVLVEEGPVADLPGGHPQHVVRVHALHGLHGVGAAELPLVQRREVPHADALAHGAVLALGVAEAAGPPPAALVDEGGTHRRLDVVERAPDGVAHGPSSCLHARPPRPARPLYLDVEPLFKLCATDARPRGSAAPTAPGPPAASRSCRALRS